MCFICIRKQMQRDLLGLGMSGHPIGIGIFHTPKPSETNIGKASEPKEEVPVKPVPKASTNHSLYPKYFKSVVNDTHIDVYRVHQLFNLNNEMLCHASKKLLLAGERTGEKSLRKDVIEARDTLNRYLELNP